MPNSPLAPLAEAEAAPSPLELEAAGVQPRPRVLVVDDDERNLLAIRTVIEDLAEVETASSGEEALRHLLKGEFAVILLDVYMPGMDGYEAAEMIRSREQTKRVPIVFLSAINKEKEHLLRGYAMGAVDYVFKPVEPVVLRSKVAVFVDLFRMTCEVKRKAEQERALLDANLEANAERLRIERELRVAEQRQAAIIGSLPIVLYLEPERTSPRVPQFVGGNFSALTGFALDDVEKNPNIWAQRLHPEDRERTLRALEDRQRNGAMAIEYRWQCADGSYRHFLDQAVRLTDGEDGAVQYAGTLLDVSEQRALEGQLLQARKMDAIGKLTGGIAHDFNNLLAAVLGGIGLIERRIELDEEQGRIVAMTRRAAEQGSELIRRLLAFARRQQLQPDSVDPAALAASVNDLLAHTLGGLVTLEWEIEEGVSRAWADSTQLELALMNLIINARDAMPEGGRIAVTARNSGPGGGRLGLAPGDYVVFAVADTGSGIAPELLEQVTEPFFTTKAVGEGTGLGLSMVYGFAQQSGGAIDIDSTLGEGTRVEIWLPAAAPGELVEPKADEVSEAAETGSLRILLVDDHDGVREATAGMLRDLGHSVEAANDGASVVERLKENAEAYDLIITDYAMPLMSGVEMLKQARLCRPNLPGLIISGFPSARTSAIDAAEALVLSKPFTLDQLKSAIAAAVCSKQAKQTVSLHPHP